ncbi:MAG: RluA family pseudouridine synthase [Melioribacter sp.]|uniref:RluA family pseudouridine synthase n=1 Tax=Rosettibacter primus TaxID=3111523 RepID=UPI00247C3934|nr:RluA family pseudouridine synthase [Melioribacter sp.]
MRLKILYEDDKIIAVDKPEGISSIKENDKSAETVHSILQKEYNGKLFIVHRLDKDVSGVMLFAKNSLMHKFLNKQFENHLIEKKYIALVHGILSENTGLINKKIRQFGSGRMGVDEVKGKKSRTKYDVLERFNSFTLLKLTPETGRRHQLRVHLYSIGHPIVGDLHYGEKSLQKNFSRLMLHAEEIEFFIEDEKKMKIKSPLPESFLNVINEIGKL